MLKRLVAIAGSAASADSGGSGTTVAVPATRVLDGFGAFTAPPASARPIPANFNSRATFDHPPGFYGPPEGLVAVNTLAPADRPAPIDYSALNARMDVYRKGEPLDLRGPVMMGALGLLVLDAIVMLFLSGAIATLTRRRRAVAAVLALAMVLPVLTALPVHAQSSAAKPADDFAMKSTLQTRLAYVITGDAQVDGISKAGLQGLTLFLGQRTALEAGEPIGLDPARDELAFFPLIYWPVLPSAGKPSQQALERIDAYMKRGGTILFDTRDAIDVPPGGSQTSAGMVALRTILSSLDIPEIEPVPRDHVLTKTFFLLRDFPGRYNAGQLWVEAMPADEEEDPNRPARAGDGVSSIMITSNDLAGAWALRPDGQPMLPLVPGDQRQREFAFRAGVNIVMYALTGNYKADQVHIPALLERLGQ
jgi:hypothetical protein